MSTWSSRVLTVVLVGLAGVFAMHLIDRWLGARADLTEDNLYSLSEGSLALMERMDQEGVQPVEVRLYFSETVGKSLPKFIKDFITYERYLRSLLREYERAAGGRMKLEFLDPITDSDEAEAAADYGLDGKLINQEGDLFYFGLAFETETGSREVIEFLWPHEQENVEYEISKALYRLLWPERARVGVLSSLEVFGSSQDPFMAQMLAAQGRQPTPKWLAVQVLEELYDVEQVANDTDSISNDDLDLLIVIHPKDLPKKTVAAIDQYIQRGGDAMIFVDAYALDDRPPQNAQQQPWQALQYKPASNLDEMLRSWGIARPEDQFAADFDLAVRRPVSQLGAAESVIVDLRILDSHWEEAVDTTSPIFQGLGDLRFLLAGALELTSGAEPASDEADDQDAAAAEGGESESTTPSGSDLEVVPLISTTARGNMLPVQPGFATDGLGYTDFNQPAKLRDNFVPGSKPVVLAYLLRGRFPTAWPDGVEYPDKEAERPPNLPPGIELPPPDDAVMLRMEPVAEEERGEAAVMVFSDVDFISDQLAFVQSPFGIIQAANDNHRVLLNGADFLLGSEELMAIRSTKKLSRPFELFDQIEADAERDTLEREREIREQIETFQQELRDKQSSITARNASLFQKNLQDEVDQLNEQITESNRQLREIRKGRREALEWEESKVRFAVMGWMPIAVLIGGFFFARRRISGR